MPPVSQNPSKNLELKNGISSIISNYEGNTHFVDLSQQNLNEIPKNVIELKKLRIIIFNNNDLKDSQIFESEFPMLKKIDLDKNHLKNFPKPKCLDKLRELILSNNLLTEFPHWLLEDIWYFFEYLDISCNPLFSLIKGVRPPWQYHQMRNILYLNLSNTEMSTSHLPLLKYFPTLKKLDISSYGYKHNTYSYKHNNFFYSIPYESFPSNLEILIMINVGLNTFPFLNLEFLLVLDLSYNSLSYIPNIITYTSLEKLILRKCDLCWIPKDLGTFKSLVHLDLSDNDISVIPQCIKECTKLKYLDLYDNKLSAYPELLNELSLEKLDLSQNYFPLPEMCGQNNYSDMEKELRKINNCSRRTGFIECYVHETDEEEYSSPLSDNDFYSETEPEPLNEIVLEETPEEIWNDESADDWFDPNFLSNQEVCVQTVKDNSEEDELKDCMVTCPREIMDSQFFYHPGQTRFQKSFYTSYKKIPVVRTFPVEEGQFNCD